MFTNERLHPKTLRTLLESFYDQLSLSTSQQPFIAMTDASKSIMFNASVHAPSFHHRTAVRPKSGKGLEGDGEVRRHIERLLLRLDFNGGFSRGRQKQGRSVDILKEGGLA
jgi:gamma-tubulin complex component 4